MPETHNESGKSLWLRAGQQLLRRGGIGAVKIQSLQDETGLTTGSFYHHFKGMPDYLAHLASHWGGDTPGHLEEAADPDPRTRLMSMAAIAPREDLLRLDRAMRDWAGSDDNAAAAVKRVDAALLTFSAEAFTELGFSQADSRLLAHLLVSAGVARVTPPWPRAGDHLERLVDLLAGGETNG